MWSLSDPATWTFDIDRYLNPFIPRPPWRWIPYPVAHFLGHRTQPQKSVGNLVITFWAFVGIFVGLLIIELVTKHVPVFQEHDAPITVASFGAAAVLNFYAIDSPLAQPRNTVLSQVFSSAIGVGIRKLFELSPHYASIRYIGGALSCAIATAVMALTKTVHPPAGATALLAVVNNEYVPLGWWLVPMVLLGSVLMIAVGLVINNIQRRFPIYWWTPEQVGQALRRSPADEEVGTGHEGKMATPSSASFRDEPQVIIRRGQVIVPSGMYLTPEGMNFLEEISERL